MKVRLYGPTMGNGSFVRVASGMRRGLEACGVFAGFVPTDTRDEDVTYPGHDAEYGVYIGPPGNSAIVRAYGWHKHRLALLPPNSSWIPKSILSVAQQFVTGYIAPSTFARNVLESHTKLPVHLWYHGVSESFKPNADLAKLRREVYEAGRFEAIHFASTPMQRKGTRELIEAWCRAFERGKLGESAVLDLVVNGNVGDFEAVARRCATKPDTAATIVWNGRLELDEAAAADAYCRHHVVVQPSRGEGFGLVPLEARACGTPTVMTDCTGHADHRSFFNGEGTVLIKTGGWTSIDDGPEATAPSLDARDVEDALEEAYSMWRYDEREALSLAKDISKAWSWESVTEKWLESLKGKSS